MWVLLHLFDECLVLFCAEFDETFIDCHNGNNKMRAVIYNVTKHQYGYVGNLTFNQRIDANYFIYRFRKGLEALKQRRMQTVQENAKTATASPAKQKTPSAKSKSKSKKSA